MANIFNQQLYSFNTVLIIQCPNTVLIIINIFLQVLLLKNKLENESIIRLSLLYARE